MHWYSRTCSIFHSIIFVSPDTDSWLLWEFYLPTKKDYWEFWRKGMTLTPNMLLFSVLCYCMLIFELDRYNQLYANAHAMLASTQIKWPHVWRTFGMCPTLALTIYLQSSKCMRCSLCCKSWFRFYNVNYEILIVHVLCFVLTCTILQA